jgi:hypothetical protein
MDSKIDFDAKQWRLLMFVHPHCPCTRASIAELERLFAQISTPLQVQVIFVKPVGSAPDWTKTDLWRSAASIQGVKIYTDDDGVEAHRFHARTSGLTLLYSPDGELKFQGGITVARGHAGDNPGLAGVREWLQEGRSTQIKNPAFGCDLFDASCRKEDVLCKP